MMPISPVSFVGNVTLGTNRNRCIKDGMTRQQVINSYSEVISDLKNRQEFAGQLIDLMNGNRLIQARIKDLPDDVEIKVLADFEGNNDGIGGLDISNPSLSVSEKTLRRRKLDMDDRKYLFEVQFNEKGPNEAFIVEWLDDLRGTFGSKVKNRANKYIKGNV